jgi:hypothetical protein
MRIKSQAAQQPFNDFPFVPLMPCYPFCSVTEKSLTDAVSLMINFHFASHKWHNTVCLDRLLGIKVNADNKWTFVPINILPSVDD